MSSCRRQASHRRTAGASLKRGLWLILASAVCALSATEVLSQTDSITEQFWIPNRVVHADVVALDQLLVYNRFGSFNPYGMIFALRRDASALEDDEVPAKPTAHSCGSLLGTEAGTGPLYPGRVRLKDCKRPRPLVLRANVGDLLEVTITNLLRKDQPDISADESQTARSPEDLPAHFCEEHALPGLPDPARPVRRHIRTAFEQGCIEARNAEQQKTPAERNNDRLNGKGDWPRTRWLSFVIPGLEPVPLPGRNDVDGRCLGLDAAEPGQTFTCRWRLDREGNHLFSSLAAPSGGEGDNGSLGHGLFGALIVEPAESSHYRSQVTRAAFDAVWPPKAKPDHARSSAIAYGAAVSPTAASSLADPVRVRQAQEALDRLPGSVGRDCGAAVPVLALVRACGNAVFWTAADRPDTEVSVPLFELLHGDLTALIVPPPPKVPLGDENNDDQRLTREASTPFREFAIIFHDELTTFYTDEFRELEEFGQLSGIRDGFAINYGSSGLGAIVVAQRKGIGPAARCPECLYEEFFLQSWANGDPALLETFPEDPSNVYHSYLNDRVVFRNLHAGKETHVFHLHTHQWLAGNDQNRGSYLDSQTIAPQQGFTYRIYHGGLDRYRPPESKTKAGGGDTKEARAEGWWESLGAGNRNRTPGDAIFHCHLYPHFAQGMWSLWRVHDVLEDGSRVLPDGQGDTSLSLDAKLRPARPGTVNIETGERIADAQGTPIPGLIPIPEQAAPLLPTYGDKGMVGYPFYIAARPGHRAPQPPLDMARNEVHANGGLTSPVEDGGIVRQHVDGGLPRHIVVNGKAVPAVATAEERAAPSPEPGSVPVPVARMLALGDITSELDHLHLEVLPQNGTFLERNAMSFHHRGEGISLINAEGREIPEKKDQRHESPYPSLRIDHPGPGGTATLGNGGFFAVNGAPAASGAPYADPCGGPTSLAGTTMRRFDGEKAMTPFRLESISDPFKAAGSGSKMVPDPGLIGFRRFDVSAIQIDLVVNRAGWHDPQARINVLSKHAADWKNRKRSDAEPFFFRAFSGECIEFRHTNETPKDLELDDFQLKVPTDTIGEHIHLVKFDVTSSDGSGNGFNYEDGTFSSGEILERICAARKTGGGSHGRAGETVEPIADRTDAECAPEFRKRIWKRARINEDRKYFQTTIQRWFADPLLSFDGETTKQGPGVADRTLRTVFTHDHFTPSNIQQHGFYAALLIEPQSHAFCLMPSPENPSDRINACVTAPPSQRPPRGGPLAGDPQADHVGARASVFVRGFDGHTPGPYGEPIHPNAREYALAIADFALLYDGAPGGRLDRSNDPSAKGLDRLVGEAECTINTVDPANPDTEANERIPALEARLCLGKDRQPAKIGGSIEPNPDFQAEVAKLRTSAERWRDRHGWPVEPPIRPESISQKHHNPYLVNYRHEPIPLRVGAYGDNTPPAFAFNPCHVSEEQARPGRENHNNIVAQRSGKAGDFANAFRTKFGNALESSHGDPCPPILEALQNERILVRMIQGAQEVQHMFAVEGRSFRRNIDQPFPTARPMARSKMPDNNRDPRAPDDNRSLRATDNNRGLRAADCLDHSVARRGRPREFPDWATGLKKNVPFWMNFERLIAGCDNALGYVSAQEIGISEHFELGGIYRADIGGPSTLGFRTFRLDGAPPAAPNGTGKPLIAEGILDQLYSYGSMDALWNGAWSLVRTYRDSGVPDYSRCLAVPDKTRPNPQDCLNQPPAIAPIGARIRSFVELAALAAGKVPPSASLPVNPTIKACPDSVSPRKFVLAAVVAKDLHRAGGQPDGLPDDLPGLAYDPSQHAGLFDQDALLLVAFKHGELSGVPGIDEAFQSDSEKEEEKKPPGIIDRAAIIAAAKKRFATRRPEPAVIRVNAGDCIKIVYVNALPPSREKPTRLDDAEGDALMPDIVPLNVDAPRNQNNDRDARPSRRVAFSIPISATTLGKDMPWPFGLNPTGAIDTEKQNWALVQYYAGFVSVNADEVHQSFRSLGPQPLSGREFLHGGGVLQREPGPCTGARLEVFGQPFCVPLGGAQNPSVMQTPQFRGLESQLRQAFEQALAKNPNLVTFTPYAFGGIPIRAVGDMFGHGSHGLYGTLIVEPRGSVCEGTELSAPDPNSPEPPCPLRSSVIRADAAVQFKAEPSGTPRTIPEAKVREHVLVWQDGLNIWSKWWGGETPRVTSAEPNASEARARADGGVQQAAAETNGEAAQPARQSGVAQPEGLGSSATHIIPGHPLPNCPACDDSYDLGEKGVSYRTAPFSRRLAGVVVRDARGQPVEAPQTLGIRDYPQDKTNLNGFVFPKDFFSNAMRVREGAGEIRPVPTPVLEAKAGEQVTIRVNNPQGRARQRAFIMLGAGYDDIFPGFGSSHSSLLGPGKTVNASFCAPRTPSSYLLRDGPQFIFASGVWAQLKVGSLAPLAASQCR